MAIVTLDGGQSSIGVAGQSTTYIVSKILTRMPAAPDALINSELQDVLRHFYTQSTAWREVVGPYVVGQGQAGVDYTVFLNPVDQYKQVQAIWHLWTFPSLNGASFPGRIDLVPYKQVGSDIGPPRWAWPVKPDTLVLYPSPDKNYGAVLFAFVSLLPVINTPQLPTIAMTHHLDALMWGTMARLHAMKAKPWSDKALAAEYKRDYMRAIMQHRDEANRMYGNINTPFRYPPFAPQRNAGMPWAVRN